MKKIRARKLRSVDQYLTLLKAANRSDITLRNYRQILKQYAEFLQVPLEELHNNLNSEDLVRYSACLAGTGKREASRKSTLSTLHRYMYLNGVEFDELEYNVATSPVTETREDKPITPDLLQKMMDQGNSHSRAYLSFLVSTGCRAGEVSQILISDLGTLENGVFVRDISGCVVRIRNEIAKRKKGGLVFLTAEAREYLDIWLKDRPAYILEADARTKHLFTASTRHERIPRKDTGKPIRRQENDQRLFACSYSTLDKTFSRLYDRVDGEHGRAGAKVTSHSCRGYFRTHAAKTMGIDLAEGILRHTGYLNPIYVRMADEEKYNQFRDGESALYITRGDQRTQQSEIDKVRREGEKHLAELTKAREQMEDQARRLKLIEAWIQDSQTGGGKTP